MVKSNYSIDEIGKITKEITSNINVLFVRLNKAGNIVVINPKINFEKFTLYNVNNKYLWRRFGVDGYCYPLNMKGRKYHKSKDGYYEYDSTSYNYDGFHFNTIDEAIQYFVIYYKKHAKNYLYINL